MLFEGYCEFYDERWKAEHRLKHWKEKLPEHRVYFDELGGANRTYVVLVGPERSKPSWDLHDRTEVIYKHFGFSRNRSKHTLSQPKKTKRN